MALGSIYNHFASKEDMFAAIIAENHPYLQIMPLIREARGDTVDNFLRNAAKSLVDELDNRPEFLNLMLIELVEFKGQHAPKLFEIIFPDIMAIAGHVSTFQDDLRPIPPALLMRAFIGMFFSYFLTGLLLKGLIPESMQENALDQFVDIFLNGIKRPAQTITPDPGSAINISETL
jgi:AcrR family transcriptional regulator